MPKTTSHKRFSRSKKPPTKRIAIQSRDMEIFKALAEYRFLDTKQIFALFREGKGQRYFQRRLQLLFHHGFLDRPPSQLSYYRTRGQMVYALGNKGADAIYGKETVSRGKIDWQQKNREVKFPFLDHALMISDFRAILTLALKGRPPAKVELISWRQGNDLRDYTLSGGRRIIVDPDAFFTLKFPNEPRDRNTVNFFLEADHSTMTLDRFLNKMRSYWRWWTIKGHQRKFGIAGFRVLTVAISEQRTENLRGIVKQADDSQKGSEMFLFTCEKNYSLDEPESILKPVWQSPKDNKYHHLLE